MQVEDMEALCGALTGNKVLKNIQIHIANSSVNMIGVVRPTLTPKHPFMSPLLSLKGLEDVRITASWRMSDADRDLFAFIEAEMKKKNELVCQ